MTAPVPPGTRIFGETDLLDRFARPREGTLVFTNGVFDILHRGHVEYLFAARALGDALVVGVNTDASVRRLKGPDRPINPEQDRVLVLAGLGCVDGVVLFDDNTPERLIATLLPDVLVKGADYRPEDVAGREAVLAAGGRVEVITLVPGRSTTEIIRRLRETP
jgi:D-beta-D-heptose 7-phosphate kinase/D-beta-D-heptose 1-phosphate adenosyltransferase